MTAYSDNPTADFYALGEPIDVPDGTCLFRPGDESSAFLMVKSGAVRVEQTNSSGRTMVLYRVTPGESCVLTTACLLSGKTYAGYGYAEGAVCAVAIAANKFRSLLASDPQFQELVFRGFAARVGELTGVIDDLLEHRTDLRLARWLAKHNGQFIRKTQQELAQELGTAREVVSRTLKSFEHRGWIVLGRGYVTIVNAPALRQYADGCDM